MMTINNLYKFDTQMKRFKKHSRLVVAKEPDKGYFMAGSESMFDFLDFKEYNPNILGRRPEFVQNILINNFFMGATPHAIYYIEAWKTDPDKEFYIKLKETRNSGEVKIFEIWNYYEVTKVELTLIRDPHGITPKLIKLKTLEHTAHYVGSKEIA